MGISLRASVATAVSRRPRRHRSDLYTMIEEALHKQRNKMTMGKDVPVWKSNTAIFKPKFNKNLSTLNLYLVRYSFQVALHSIWRERNNRRHGSQPVLAGHRLQSSTDRFVINV
ncbi:unnamed protein product [Brassica napus]|uniref:(rape) hypothetical protein n=1 Tax=Brassica napus TaxID=3708 RepID=A0A816IXM8_BRANA|nr:unnamed protein product [Brassica napus]